MSLSTRTAAGQRITVEVAEHALRAIPPPLIMYLLTTRPPTKSEHMEMLFEGRVVISSITGMESGEVFLD